MNTTSNQHQSPCCVGGNLGRASAAPKERGLFRLCIIGCYGVGNLSKASTAPKESGLFRLCIIGCCGVGNLGRASTAPKESGLFRLCIIWICQSTNDPADKQHQQNQLQFQLPTKQHQKIPPTSAPEPQLFWQRCLKIRQMTYLFIWRLRKKSKWASC